MIRNLWKKVFGDQFTAHEEKLAAVNFGIVVFMFLVSGIMLFILPDKISILHTGDTYYPIPSVIGVWLFPLAALLINMILIKQKRSSKLNVFVFGFLFVVMIIAYCTNM